MQPNLVDAKPSQSFFPLVHMNYMAERKMLYYRTLTGLFIVIEFLVVSAFFFLLFFLRISEEFNYNGQFLSFNLPRLEEYLIFYFLVITIYSIWSYNYENFYFNNRKSLSDQLFKIIKAYSYAVLFTIGIAFFIKIVAYSRLVVIGFWLGGIFLSGIIHLMKRLLFLFLARKGKITQNVLLVGAGKVGLTVCDEYLSNAAFGYRVVGFVDDYERKSNEKIPILGKIEEIPALIKRFGIDEIVVTIPSQRNLVDQLIKELRKFNVQIKIIPDMFNLVLSTVEFGQINAMPYVTLIKTPMRGIALLLKRVFDSTASIVALLLLLPVFILTSVCIKLDSKGPIIYKQKRVGKNGQIFNMYKFRSMISNADDVKDDLTFQNEVDGPAFKIKHDPRVTRVGKFIRKYSIDELPQLFNVLKGTMSLVGPRPPLPNEVECYGDWEWRRLEVLPGITGLWQVSGRSDLSFQQWMNLDVYYIENWSLALDLKIILKTIPTVLKGEGAY